MDQSKINELKEIVKMKENNRKLLTKFSLQNLCLQRILDRKEIDAHLIKTLIAPPLRTALMEKLTAEENSHPEGALVSAYRLLSVLVHQSMPMLCLPGSSRKRRLSINDSTELEKLAEDIAVGAPAVMRLRIGKNLPYPLRTKLLATDQFLTKWNQMRNLQCLEALSLKCNSRHLKLMVDNLPNLRYLQIDLDLQDKHFNKEGIYSLQKLHHLELFHFAEIGTKVSDLEVKHVSLCLKLLPKLRSVGRYYQHIFWKNYDDLSAVTNYYHDIWGYDCSKIIPSSSPCQLGLQEFFITGDWDPFDAALLPKLKYLHIRNGPRSDYLHIPNTVTTLGLYENVRCDRLFMSFPHQLCSLTLQNCNLRKVASGGILKQCPNLELLRLRHCRFDLSDIAQDPASVDMSRSRLQRVTLMSPCHVIPNGVLSLLLQAPLLVQVEISVSAFHIHTEEKMSLVEQIRSGRILQKISIGRFYDQSLLELSLAVRAYCPKAFDINDK